MASIPGDESSSRPGLPAAPRAALDRLKLAKLRACLTEILPANSFYAAKLGASRALPESLAEFSTWPVTTKEELVAGAAATGLPANLTYPLSSYVRCHRTSGTHGRPMP